MRFANVIRFFILVSALALPWGMAQAQAQDDPLELFDWLESSPYAERVDQSDKRVRAHLVALGRINKVRGDWNPEEDERVNGRVLSSTWQIIEGASSAEMFDEVVALIEQRGAARQLFSCSGRSCGPSVQWANLVFGQRILYGTESSQHYRVYALEEEASAGYRVLVYASARTSDRQYLHTEIVVLAP